MAANEELNDDKIVNKVIRESQSEILKELNKGTIDLKKAISELTNVTKNDIIGTKQRVNDIKSLHEAIKQNTSIYKQAIDETKKSNTITGQAKKGLEEDKLTSQYILQRRFSAIGSISEGRLVSGARDLFSTFKMGEKVMKSGWFLALELGARLLLKFDENLSKTVKSMTAVTGGLGSQLVDNRFKALQQRGDLKESLREIGLQGKVDELLGTASSNYGQAYLKNNLSDVLRNTGYARYGLGSFGISDQTFQNLIANLSLLEGKSSTGINAQLKRLTDRFQVMSIFSPEQALQQATSLYDQTKHLGTNFEWASKTIQNFEKQLKLGTVFLSDFAAANRSFQSGGVTKNAGTSAMLIDFAQRSGIQLPQSLLASNAIGQGFALSAPDMLGNNNIARAMSGKITEMLDEMGLLTKYERAGGLQHILSNMFGINISSQSALNSLTQSGSVDLIQSGVAGFKAMQRQDKEAQDAEEYNKLVKEYYKGTESYQKIMKDYVGGIYNKLVGSSVRTGLSEGMSTSGLDVFRNFAALASPAFWKALWEAENAHIDTRLYPTNPDKVPQ